VGSLLVLGIHLQALFAALKERFHSGFNIRLFEAVLTANIHELLGSSNQLQDQISLSLRRPSLEFDRLCFPLSSNGLGPDTLSSSGGEPHQNGIFQT
jgi:hypothetical protein